MNKPLSEWTAKEIVEECDRHVCCSSECRCYNSERKECRLKPFPPPCWNLSEPPRWTEQDKEDAANMKRALPLANNISRSTKGDLLVDFKGPEIYPGFFVYYGLFPSLKPGESATLDEIIGDGDQ